MNTSYIFDFDGVILDSTDSTYKALNAFFTERGRVFSKLDFERIFMGNLLEQFYDMGFNEADKNELFKYYDHYDKNCKVYPKMIKALKELKKKGELIIISSHYKEFIIKKLEEFKILPLFSKIFGHEAPGNKAEKIIKLKTSRSKIFYIGDTVGDISEAKVAGVISVATTWGFHSKKLLIPTNPDVIINTPMELLSLTSHEDQILS